MNRSFAIDPSDYFAVSSQIGWGIITGCTVTHSTFGLGRILGASQFISIHFENDPEGKDRMFQPWIFEDKNVLFDLEVSQDILEKIEAALGHPIEKTDPTLAKRRRELYRVLLDFNFKCAERILQETKEQLCEENKELYQQEIIRLHQHIIQKQYQKMFYDLEDLNFESAEQIFQEIKDNLNEQKISNYLKEKVRCYQMRIQRQYRDVFHTLKNFNFENAERIFQEIKDDLDTQHVENYYKERDRCHQLEIQKQNDELVRATLFEIDKLLSKFNFAEARTLFERIEHLYSKALFEQEILRYQISNELANFNFINAELLFTKSDTLTAEEFRSQKAEAIQRFFNDPHQTVTHEQALALAEDSQSLLIKARAGSGKTRVLAGKVALLIDRYKVNPDKVLVLAFNKKAALEIGTRIQQKFGIETFENARTFHSLAYQLLRTPEKLLFNEQDEFSRPALSNFVQDVLRNIWSPEIQLKLYQLFRKELRSLERSGALLNDADYLAYVRNQRDISLGGDRVKSTGEKFIADYLFEHDIVYFYEQVEFWSGHNYRPDFTLFSENRQIVIEFWGIDQNASQKSLSTDWSITWDQYYAQMQEKRKYWAQKNIPLVEMSVADLRGGRTQFENILGKKLEQVGIKKEKLAQKELEKKVIRFQKDRMTELFVQLIQKAKKEMLSEDDLLKKVSEFECNDDRTKLFLNLGCHVYASYQKRLREEGYIDFDDLIMKAAELILETNGHCTIDLGPRKDRHICIKDIEWILVDEFQDFSGEFNHLLTAIRAVNPSVRITCVGDDWQAINSFAGSDLKFFERYGSYFPNSKTVNLLQNHRSQRAIVEHGNKIMNGRGEPSKPLLDRSNGEVRIQAIDDIRIDYRESIDIKDDNANDRRFVFFEMRETGKKVNDNGFLQAKYLKACYQIITESQNWEILVRSQNPTPTIAILSRTNRLYRVTLNEFLDQLKGCFSNEQLKAIGNFRQKIKIGTIHSFKGLEADIVIILRVCDGAFPLLHPDNRCFLILNWSPPVEKINFKNEPTWTLQSPVNQHRRQGDEKGGRLRTDTESVSYRRIEHSRDKPPV